MRSCALWVCSNCRYFALSRGLLVYSPTSGGSITLICVRCGALSLSTPNMLGMQAGAGGLGCVSVSGAVYRVILHPQGVRVVMVLVFAVGWCWRAVAMADVKCLQCWQCLPVLVVCPIRDYTILRADVSMCRRGAGVKTFKTFKTFW